MKIFPLTLTLLLGFTFGYFLGLKSNTPHDIITIHADGEVTIEPIEKGKAWISYSNKPGKGSTIFTFTPQNVPEECKSDNPPEHCYVNIDTYNGHTQ